MVVGCINEVATFRGVYNEKMYFAGAKKRDCNNEVAILNEVTVRWDTTVHCELVYTPKVNLVSALYALLAAWLLKIGVVLFTSEQAKLTFCFASCEFFH